MVQQDPLLGGGTRGGGVCMGETKQNNRSVPFLVIVNREWYV